jgi:hypothetical protein
MARRSRSSEERAMLLKIAERGTISRRIGRRMPDWLVLRLVGCFPRGKPHSLRNSSRLTAAGWVSSGKGTPLAVTPVRWRTTAHRLPDDIPPFPGTWARRPDAGRLRRPVLPGNSRTYPIARIASTTSTATARATLLGATPRATWPLGGERHAPAASSPSLAAGVPSSTNRGEGGRDAYGRSRASTRRTRGCHEAADHHKLCEGRLMSMHLGKRTFPNL